MAAQFDEYYAVGSGPAAGPTPMAPPGQAALGGNVAVSGNLTSDHLPVIATLIMFGLVLLSLHVGEEERL